MHSDSEEFTKGKFIEGAKVEEEMKLINDLVDLNLAEGKSDLLNSKMLTKTKYPTSSTKNATYYEFFKRNMIYDEFLKEKLDFLYIEDSNKSVNQFVFSCQGL